MKSTTGGVRLTAKHFGYSPDTISRWVRAYQKLGVPGLEPKSRRPKRVRQPQTPWAVVQRIQELREQYPRWGREKLKRLLAEGGTVLSAKSIDPQARLKARGVLREPLRPRRKARRGKERLRGGLETWLVGSWGFGADGQQRGGCWWEGDL